MSEMIVSRFVVPLLVEVEHAADEVIRPGDVARLVESGFEGAVVRREESAVAHLLDLGFVEVDPNVFEGGAAFEFHVEPGPLKDGEGRTAGWVVDVLDPLQINARPFASIGAGSLDLVATFVARVLPMLRHEVESYVSDLDYITREFVDDRR